MEDIVSVVIFQLGKKLCMPRFETRTFRLTANALSIEFFWANPAATINLDKLLSLTSGLLSKTSQRNKLQTMECLVNV